MYLARSVIIFFIFVKTLEASISENSFNRAAFACERQTLTLRCGQNEILSIISANYGRLSSKVCTDNEHMSNLNCRASTSLQTVKQNCDRRKECSISATNDVFGDPCYGTFKYLEVLYTCKKDSITEYTCENEELNIKCRRFEKIRIISANYGRRSRYICQYQENGFCYGSKSKSILEKRCNGKNRCKITANNTEFGDPCEGVIKYLEVQYKCEK